MKAYSKTLFRMLKRHLGRFLAVTAIIALGIGFMTGLGSVKPKLIGTLDKYYSDRAVPDLIIKSATGFSQAQTDALEQFSDAYTFMPVTALDADMDGSCVRIQYMPLSDLTLNKLELLEGELPRTSTEIVAERESRYFRKYEVGDVVSYMGREFTVSGIAVNPLMFSEEEEPSLTDSEKNIDAVFYFDSALTYMPVVSDMYVRINSAHTHKLFSKKYDAAVVAAKTELETALGVDAENMAFLTLRENFSSAMYEEYAQKVYNISIIFSVFFVGVSVLVISTTMTRLAEEERSAIGCYKTLGYDDGKIMFKYLFFSMFSCIIGSLCGFLGITNLLVYLICNAFSFAFRMPPVTNEISWVFGGISVFCMLAAVLLVTWRVVSSMTKEKPAALLRPKSPKPGKKILLERIGFIWKKMSFKYKSTYRNLFRYARNFILTVISIAGSTALVFAGLGLYDSSVALEKTEGAGSTSSMTAISAVLIVCAALLSILVIYNLTNINIEERKREIATLKVLGYKNNEVCGYIFREITVLSVIGTALGIPLGYGFSVFVFEYVDFGSIADMHWYSWLGTAILSLLFSAVVMALLCSKIIKTDMNASLKTVD
ncbi:MAG: FtsX-like permease family protein [Christensenellales bacterium]